METFEGVDTQELRLWIVGRSEEFLITFDECSGNYGLAFRTIMNTMVYLGSDGSLVDAYTALTSREDDRDHHGRKSFKPSRRR